MTRLLLRDARVLAASAPSPPTWKLNRFHASPWATLLGRAWRALRYGVHEALGVLGLKRQSL